MLSGLDILPGPGDDPRLDQVAHDRGEELRMEAQILLVKEGVTHRVGHPAQTQLDAVPVMDKIRRVGADLQVGLRGHASDIVERSGIVRLHDQVHLLQGDLQRAREPGQIRVYLQDHSLRVEIGVLLPHAAAGHREVPVLVHGCCCRDELVDHRLILRPPPHHVVEVGGKMGRDSHVVTLPQGPVVEVTDHIQSAPKLRHLHKGIDVSAAPLSLDQLDVRKPGRHPVEVLVEELGFAELSPAADHVSVPERCEHILYSSDFLPVLCIPIHKNTSSFA